MLALVLAMLLCVALGAGVVGFVMIEARREGRGGFWTPEGEELIAGARRRGEQVRHRGEQLGRSAAQRTQALRERRQAAAASPASGPTVQDEPAPAAPEAPATRPEPTSTPAGRVAQPTKHGEPAEDEHEDYRAAS